MYLFEIPHQQAVAFVGSSNLTSGGLYTNYEANLGIELDLTAAADQEIYQGLLSVFLNASDTATGNAKRLDATLLEELIRTGKVTDESRPATRRGNRKRAPEVESPLFPRTPVSPAPRIAPHLAQLIPKVKPTGDAEAVQEAITALKPWEMFVMVLGPRDTRQEPGYSRDIYIPLAAREHSPEFWGWPSQFRPGSITTTGSYTERRVDMLIRPVTRQAQVAEGVRLYHYDIKDEFRLNCGRLIEGAKPGDLLVIQRSPAGTLFDGRTYEFEATVIGTLHPEYDALKKECRNRVKGSSKQWGYA
jgi:hypothetical protein